VKIGAGIDPK